MDFDKLVVITVDYLSKMNSQDLPSHHKSNQPDSCWGIICSKLTGKYDRLVSLHIQTMWRKNTKKFNDKVKVLIQKCSNNGLIEQTKNDSLQSSRRIFPSIYIINKARN